MKIERRLCLQDLPLFNDVEPEVFSKVCGQAASRRNLRRGDILFNQGDIIDTLFLIKAGSFKLARVNEEGKEVILHVAAKGEVLGETALFRSGTHPATAIALEDARVCALNRRSLEEIIRESPDLALQVISSLANRLYSTWEQFTELRTGSIRDKVLNLFIRLAVEHGEASSEGTLIKIRLTQQDIADFIGASRVMVVQVLKELTDQKYIYKIDKYYMLKDRCF